MKIAYLTLLCLVAAYDKKKFASNGGFTDKLVANSQESERSREQHTETETEWSDYFDISKCDLVDGCKPCSFKELQKWPECQKNGFRLIKKCR